jgi:hypothetical protein
MKHGLFVRQVWVPRTNAKVDDGRCLVCNPINSVLGSGISSGLIREMVEDADDVSAESPSFAVQMPTASFENASITVPESLGNSVSVPEASQAGNKERTSSLFPKAACDQGCMIAVAEPFSIEASQQVTEQDAEQKVNATATLKVSPMAITSIILLLPAIPLAIVSVVYDAKFQASGYGNNDPDYDYWVAAVWSGAISLSLFAIAIITAFCAGRGYSYRRRQQQPNWKMEKNDGSCCACHLAMAIIGWLLFLFCVATEWLFPLVGEPAISAVFFLSNCLAWGVMFGYSEMMRKGRDFACM